MSRTKGNPLAEKAKASQNMDTSVCGVAVSSVYREGRSRVETQQPCYGNGVGFLVGKNPFALEEILGFVEAVDMCYRVYRQSKILRIRPETKQHMSLLLQRRRTPRLLMHTAHYHYCCEGIKTAVMECFYPESNTSCTIYRNTKATSPQQKTKETQALHLIPSLVLPRLPICIGIIRRLPIKSAPIKNIMLLIPCTSLGSGVQISPAQPFGLDLRRQGVICARDDLAGLTDILGATGHVLGIISCKGKGRLLETLIVELRRLGGLGGTRVRGDDVLQPCIVWDGGSVFGPVVERATSVGVLVLSV